MSLILAIDDDKNMLKLLNKQVEAMNYKMIAAHSGEEGVDMAKSGNPDLILLDLQMPGIDGFAVIRKLRMDKITKNTPIIMLTSRSDKKDVQEAMRLGVIDYIVKPYNYFSLSKKIGLGLKYNTVQKAKDAVARTNNISASRENGITIITFMANFSNPDLLQDAKRTFNPSFLKMIKNDKIVFDLRSLPGFLDTDIKPFESLMALIGLTNLNIIAGKNYGQLVALMDLEESINLFISEGDFEVFMSDGG
ncbi:MAG: response regulator [bacterium]|nr:response regulator [bacterium]